MPEPLQRETTDWSKYITEGETPARGKKVFKPGQVYVFGWKDWRAVFRVVSFDPRDLKGQWLTVEWLCSPRQQPHNDKLSNSYMTERAVLIQDVDQEPIPPEMFIRGSLPFLVTSDGVAVQPGMILNWGGLKWIVDALCADGHLLWTLPDGTKGCGANSIMIRDAVFAGWSANRRPSPPPRTKGKRQVSNDGLAYIDYDGMADPDPFETYPHYRVKEADGSFSVDEHPVALKVSAIDHCHRCGNEQGPFGYKNECWGCHQIDEIRRAIDMRQNDGDGSGLVRARSRRPIIQSHATLWGGVISLRE